jgi:hypothetical protein
MRERSRALRFSALARVCGNGGDGHLFVHSGRQVVTGRGFDAGSVYASLCRPTRDGMVCDLPEGARVCELGGAAEKNFLIGDEAPGSPKESIRWTLFAPRYWPPSIPASPF